jgi:hypothetical protein
MEVKIIMGLDGSVALVVENQNGITFEEAKAKLEAFQAQANLVGVPISWGESIEMHLHDAKGQHVHQHHGHAHNH